MENGLSGKKIKVCHVAAVDITVKFLLENQLEFLIKEGYEVHVVCSPGKWIKDIESKGIKVKTIKIKRKISLFSDLVSLLKLYFYFKKEKFDIVHTHTPKPALLGQLAAKMAGAPIVINTIHGLYFGNKFSAFKKKFYVFVEKISDSFSDLVFSQNKEDMQTMENYKIAVGKVKYLGNGIDLQKFSRQRFSEDFIKNKKRELGIKEGAKVVGTVGRLVKEKGYLELFSAFKIVLEKFPDAFLLIAGPEETEKKDAIKPEIARQFGISNNVLFLGERTDLDEIYPLMDIFVLASHREGFPRTMIEAGANELPIIATDIRGCTEVVENKKTGILFTLGDSEKLAKLIIFLLENPQFARELGKNARLKAEKEFNEKLVFEKIKTEYSNLLKEKNLSKNKKIFQLFFKRVFDVLISTIGLIVLSSLFLTIAVLIKIDSPGKIFFRQERIGKNERPFFPFKFRTMKEGAENMGLGVTTKKDDERITKIGKFLRKYAIDEFPQLINVFLGQMSLVGPRPTLRYQIEKYNDFQRKRLLVKPGLAGWALIHGRNLLSWEERIKYDVWYVENWSLWLDIKIVFLTFYLIFIKQEGVYGVGGINDDFKN
jgi:lipopolysaccharide/colanic/teichoic acid biosynthesis glycosyltransferase